MGTMALQYPTPFELSNFYNNSPTSSTHSEFPSPPGPSSLPLDATQYSHQRYSEGIRLPIDAPTQPRRYITPSTTSRKEVPAYFARGRTLQDLEHMQDEEDELLEDRPGPNATDQERIAYKRRQNTLAARRSRARKRNELDDLQRRVDFLERQSQRWELRAKALKELLQCHGIPAPDFND